MNVSERGGREGVCIVEWENTKKMRTHLFEQWWGFQHRSSEFWVIFLNKFIRCRNKKLTQMSDCPRFFISNEKVSN